MNNQKGFAHLLIILLIVVVGIVLTAPLILPKDKSTPFLAFWEKVYRPQTVEQSDLSSPSLSDTWRVNSSDDKADWQTYINQALGFSLKHPNSLTEWEESPSTSLPRTISFHQGNYNSFSLKGLYIKVTDRSQQKQYYLGNDPVTDLDSYLKEVVKASDNITINKTTLDQIPAYEIIYGNGQSMELIYTEPDAYRGPREYIAFKDNVYYRIEYHTDNLDLMKTYDQILSTFRFIDPALQDEFTNSDAQPCTDNEDPCDPGSCSFDSAICSESGYVSVIATLDLDFTAEGNLSEEAIAAQKASINKAQNSLITLLGGHDAKVYRQYKTVPNIALKVDQEALRFLNSSPLVKSVQEDTPERFN